MSEENVEMLRRVYDAFQGGGPDAVMPFFDPNVDYRAMEGALDDIGVFTGHDALRRHWEQWDEMFDDLRAEPSELIDAGEQVIAMIHLTARMKGSEASIDMRFGIVWTLRDGKIVRGREYATREESLQAAGLSE
jgi:ketosteroid isomerase-like protein